MKDQIMRGHNNLEKPPANILPPCRVCGEPGNGFHYGVNTCGACKGFYRRSLARKEPYECIQSRLCHVGTRTKRRQSCPKCRFDKCVAVGMSKESCKVGRYSLIKKSTDIKEVIERQKADSIKSQTIHTNKGPDWWQSGRSLTVNDILSACKLDTHPTSTQQNKFNENDRNPFSAKQFPDTTQTDIKDARPHGFVDRDQPDKDDTQYPLSGLDRAGSSSYTNSSEGEIDAPIPRKEGEDYLISNISSRDETGTVNRDINCVDGNKTKQSTSPLSYTLLESSTKCKILISSFDTNKTDTNYSTTFKPILYDDNRTDEHYLHQNLASETARTLSRDFSMQSSGSDSFNSSYHDSVLSQGLSESVNSSDISHPFFGIPLHDFEQYSDTANGFNDKSSQQLPSQCPSSNNENYPMEITISDNVALKSQPGKSHIYKDFQNQIVPYTSHSKPHTNMNCTEYEASINPFSTAHRRLLEQLEDKAKDKSSMEKQHFLEPDSSRHEESDIPKTAPESKAIQLYVVDPDPMKYVLSIFEEFPFKSFEKKSIGPLLKLCYNKSDWVDEYFAQSMVKLKKVPDLDECQQELTAPLNIQLRYILSSESSPQTTSPAKEPTYNAEEMDNLFDYLKKVHTLHYGPQSSCLNASEKAMFTEMFHKICQLQESLMGSLNLIDEDKYYDVLKMTGVDVDRRKEWFSCVFSGYDDDITRDAKFFRALPGFKSISLKDRVVLTKSTAWLMTGLKYFDIAIDLDLDVCINQSSNIAFRLSSLLNVIPGFRIIYDSWVSVLNTLKDMDISFDEYIVFKALLLMFPAIVMLMKFSRQVCFRDLVSSQVDLRRDQISKQACYYCEHLDNRPLVTAWHNTYLNCMLHLVRKSHGKNAEDRFNKFVGILQTLRDIRGLNKETQISMKTQFERLSEQSEQPLFTEVYVNHPYNHSMPSTGDIINNEETELVKEL